MSVLPFRKRESEPDLVRTIDAFESETAEVITQLSPRHERVMLYAIAAFFACAILLSCVLKIDRIAVAPGQIVPVQGTLVVQPLENAIIRSIHVKTGDVVKKGQILATLDPTFAKADLSQLQHKAQSLEAEVAREQAEYEGHPFVPDPSNPQSALSEAIWKQRQAQYRSSLDDFDARQRSAEAQIVRLQQDTEILRNRLKLAGNIEQMRTELERRDVGSRLNSLLAQDSRLQDEQALRSDENTLVATRHDLESLKAQREEFIQQWQTALATDLVQKRSDLVSAQQYLGEAHLLKDLTDLTAPADAVVLDVAQLSAGSVAQAANPLFTLVPLDAPLEAEVQISNQDIGFVREGDAAILKFDAFPYMRHGIGHGIVKTISPDTFTTLPDGSNVAPYFKARIRLTDTQLRNVPKSFRIVPGMTLNGDIKVGRRTIATYFTEGALKTGSEAMREP